MNIDRENKRNGEGGRKVDEGKQLIKEGRKRARFRDTKEIISARDLKRAHTLNTVVLYHDFS
jgi:hypothetical protein